MNIKIINVSEGMAEFVSAIVDDETCADLTSTTFEVGIGGFTEDDLPTSWSTPDIDETITPKRRKIGKLIDSGVSVGVHWVWIKATDTPEIVPLRIDTSVVVK